MHNLNPKIENLVKKDLTPGLRAEFATKLLQAVSTIKYAFDIENYNDSQHVSKFLHEVACLSDRIKHLRTPKYVFGDKIKFWKKSAIVCGHEFAPEFIKYKILIEGHDNFVFATEESILKENV